MKELEGSAAGRLMTPAEEAVSLLAAVDRYPLWYPEVIRRIVVLERGDDDLPRRAGAKVRLAVGPLSRDYEFEVVVGVEPGGRVTLTRMPNESTDPERLEVRWQVLPGQLRVDLEARLEVPRLVPVRGVGDSVAQGFVEAARRVLDGSSPKASASSS
jgi:Polyketide cyclase / dehydrase and lipid transport